MNRFLLISLTAILLTGCSKAVDAIIDKGTTADDTNGFVLYTIEKGKQYCDKNFYTSIETQDLRFLVKFDSSAIYNSVAAENQMDINKLYGFSDNNTDHHQFSARLGWRWSDNALRLFAYVYNSGVVSSKEITTIQIGSTVSCSIKVEPSKYIFTVNEVTEAMSRSAGTEKAKGYMLFPYFGGNESAPHDIKIWIMKK